MPPKKKSTNPLKNTTDLKQTTAARRPTLAMVNETRCNMISVRAALKTHGPRFISLGQSIQSSLDTLRIFHDELSVGDGQHFHVPKK